jgi:hypothetical protein
MRMSFSAADKGVRRKHPKRTHRQPGERGLQALEPERLTTKVILVLFFGAHRTISPGEQRLGGVLLGLGRALGVGRIIAACNGFLPGGL